MYTFKTKDEIIWFLVVTVGTVVAQYLVDFNPDKITDWRAWGIALGAALVRALFGAILAVITQMRQKAEAAKARDAAARSAVIE